MTVYTATAVRDGDWWVLDADVPGAIVVTQVKRLDQADAMLKDAIALATDSPESAIEVALTIALDEHMRAIVDETKAATAAAALARDKASSLQRRTAAAMKAAGLTVRDIGTMLGVSPQRVSQLLAGGDAPAKVKKAKRAAPAKVTPFKPQAAGAASKRSAVPQRSAPQRTAAASALSSGKRVIAKPAAKSRTTGARA